jgi:hypothetical protein
LVPFNGKLDPVASPLPDEPVTLRERIGNWYADLTGGPTPAQQRQAAQEAEATAILAARDQNLALTPSPNATPRQIEKLDNQAFEDSRHGIGGMSPIPRIAAERFMDGYTLGVGKNASETKARDGMQEVAGGAGSLGGFIYGPAAIANKTTGAIPWLSRLEPVAGEAWLKGVAKKAAQEAATLGLAQGLQASGGAALDSHSAMEAAGRVGAATASGAATGGIFGAAGKILPGDQLWQWAARAAGTSTALDALNGTRPWDDRPLEQKVFDYGLNALFTRRGAGAGRAPMPPKADDPKAEPSPPAAAPDARATGDEQPPASAPDASAAPANQPFDYGQYTNFRRALESGGRVDAQNQASNAYGPDQFTPNTWLRTVARAKPAWAEGMSRDELLAQRGNLERSTEMVWTLDKINSAWLVRDGQPVDNTNLYAMHHFGARGIAFARADANTRMADILKPEQIAANPYLKDLTKAQAIDNWNRRASKAGVVQSPGQSPDKSPGREPTDAAALDGQEGEGGAADMGGDAADEASPDPGEMPSLDRASAQDQDGAQATATGDEPASEQPRFHTGEPTSFKTETGASANGRFALVEADDLRASHDEFLRPTPGYPQAFIRAEWNRAETEQRLQAIDPKNGS